MVAYCENGKLCALDADDVHREELLDDLYLGQVLEQTNKNFCFVDVGLKKPGLLKKEAGFPYPHSGEKKFFNLLGKLFTIKGKVPRDIKRAFI